MPGRLLLVSPSTSYRTEAYLRAASRLGIEVVLATDLPAARYGVETHRVSFADPDGAIATLARAAPFDGVLASDEKSAALAALAGQSLCRVPYHRPEGVAAARDKRLARKTLAVARVPQPEILPPPEGGMVGEGGYPFPVVVKPPMLSGSQGVIRANTPEELAAAFARIRRILDRHPSELRADPGFFDLVVERYVDGPEVAVEAIAHRGELTVVAVFDKPDPLEGPFFEETLYVTPSRHAADVTAAIVETTRAAAAALGLDHGPVHAELRLGHDGPKVLEVAARSIGGLCSRALAPLCGSLEDILLRNALGERVALPPPSRAACGVMMIPVPKSGVLRAVGGVEAARAVAGIDGVEIAVAPGEAVRALPEGASYLGFLFGSGDRAADVESSLREAHAALRFELSPLMAMA
jgi:biotin carboxylase